MRKTIRRTFFFFIVVASTRNAHAGPWFDMCKRTPQVFFRVENRFPFLEGGCQALTEEEYLRNFWKQSWERDWDFADLQISSLREGDFGGLSNDRNPSRIDLSYNRIEKLSYRLFKDSLFASLRLNQNLISEIEGGVFDGADIELLDLSFNKLKGVSAQMFAGLNARTLELSNNEITALDRAAFSQVKNLWNIRLSNNRLNRIASHSFENSTGRYLYLSNNQIAFLEPASIEGTGVLLLDLGFNHLKDSSFSEDWLAIERSYARVNLGHNSISQVKAVAPRRTVGITSLDLSHNHIASFEGDLANLPELYELWMDHNALAALPPSLSFAPGREARLVELSVRGNKITRLPSKGYPNIQTVNLSDNLIDSLGTAPFWIMTGFYDRALFSGNRIAELPESWLPEFTAQQDGVCGVELDLSRNLLKKLPNKVVRLSSNCARISLNLRFRANQIAEMTAPLVEGSLGRDSEDRVRASVFVDLSKNALTTLPPDFISPTALDEYDLRVDLTGNPLTPETRRQLKAQYGNRVVLDE